MQFTAYRLTSFFILLVSFSALSFGLFADFFLSLIFCHYILALTYSGAQIQKLKENRQYYIPLVVLGLLGIVITSLTYPSLAFYFGVHHALSETYMALKGVQVLRASSLQRIIATRFFFNLFSYFVILRYELDFVDDYIEFYLCFALLAFVVSFTYILLCKGLESKNKKNILTFEVVGLAIMLVLFYFSVDVPFFLVVSYHVTMWVVFPAHSLPRGKSNQYLFYTVMLTALFFIFSPSAEMHTLISPMDRGFGIELSILFAYVHITLSFALSAMNPKYIRRWFYV